MSKIITFSQKFPNYHINKGNPTMFVEKILNGLGVDYISYEYFQKLLGLNTKNIASGKLTYQDIEHFWQSLHLTPETKLHTIRVGKRFKLNEKFSPRVWSKIPYHSPQIIFYDDLKIEYCPIFYSNGSDQWMVNDIFLPDFEKNVLAIRDGLKYSDMLSWFNKGFDGQIICWSKRVNYSEIIK